MTRAHHAGLARSSRLPARARRRGARHARNGSDLRWLRGDQARHRRPRRTGCRPDGQRADGDVRSFPVRSRDDRGHVRTCRRVHACASSASRSSRFREVDLRACSPLTLPAAASPSSPRRSRSVAVLCCARGRSGASTGTVVLRDAVELAAGARARRCGGSRLRHRRRCGVARASDSARVVPCRGRSRGAGRRRRLQRRRGRALQWITVRGAGG